ncbi:MAG TPA: TonB family protein [Acidobacteriaceae bacterium]
MSTVLISADWVGRVVDGRFALHEWLGGSPGCGVFRTELPQAVEKKAAIKVIPAEGAEADAYLAAWAKTSLLSHPHLMKVFRSGRFQFGTIGLVYVVTEYADEVLSQIIPERPLTATETREMLEPVLDALLFLHDKGLVHGHVKPSNILVVQDQLKLSSDYLSATGELGMQGREKSIYDAPEGFDQALSTAADVWSVGATMVEALTQRPPVWSRASHGEPVLPEGIPAPFVEIARDCLRPNPARRCTLEEIKARIVPGRPLEFPVRAVSEPEPEKSRIVPLMIGLVVALVLIGVLVLRGHKTSAPESGAQNAPAATASPADEPASRQSGSGASAKGAVAQRTMPDVTQYASSTIRGTVTVTVNATVDASGQVTNATLKSAGPSRYFADRALIAARGWKFKPALRRGQPAASEWTLKFQFRQSGTEATAREDTP